MQTLAPMQQQPPLLLLVLLLVSPLQQEASCKV
jgi:hypothetical protein